MTTTNRRLYPTRTPQSTPVPPARRRQAIPQLEAEVANLERSVDTAQRDYDANQTDALQTALETAKTRLEKAQNELDNARDLDAEGKDKLTKLQEDLAIIEGDRTLRPEGTELNKIKITVNKMKAPDYPFDQADIDKLDEDITKARHLMQKLSDRSITRGDDERQKAGIELSGLYSEVRSSYATLKQSVEEMTKDVPTREALQAKLDVFHNEMIDQRGAIDAGSASVPEIKQALKSIRENIKRESHAVSDVVRAYVKANLDFTNVCGRNSAASRALDSFFKRDLDEAFRDFEMQVRQSTIALQRRAASARGAFSAADLGDAGDLEQLERDRKTAMDHLGKTTKNNIKAKTKQKLKGKKLKRGGGDDVKDAKNEVAEYDRKIARAKRAADSGKLALQTIPAVQAYDAAAEGVRTAVGAYRARVDEMLKKLKDALKCDDGSKLKALAPVIKMCVNRLNNDARAVLLSENEVFHCLNEDTIWIARNLSNKMRLDAMSQTQALAAGMQMRMQNMMRAVELVHSNVLTVATSSVSRLEALLSGVSLVMYAFKLAKIGTAAAAAAAAEAAFLAYHRNRTLGAAPDARPPDLRYFVLFFFIFDALFSCLIVAVCWFAAQLAVDDHMSFVKDVAIDMAVCTLVSSATLVWMADIVQDKKYFEYKAASPRALRVVKYLALVVSATHAIIPYYYMMGPFYSKTLVIGMFKKKQEAQIQPEKKTG
jgi:exonuclease VII small subunit